ncbi:CopD family protein [Zavarzinia sp. CC-PAN008]|uniref:CopD family protein n=1 Tax=Zavarzinia sp. CC-PAN008 TaxID=3243332 RepID=UPI003F74AC07
MIDYAWLKAVHVAAALIWTAGMLISARTLAILAAVPVPRPEAVQALIAPVRRWDRVVTSPAMLVLWALGLWLAYDGGWSGDPWLHVKFAIAFVLSGVHGALSGQLRRLAADPARPVPGFYRILPGLVVAGVSAIALLVVAKPF